MRRREFIAGIGAAWLIELHAARAQQPAVPTIGVLDLRPPSAPQTNFVDPFRRGLAEAGFVEGRNVAIEIHSAEGRGDRLPALAANLALRRVALIFAPTGSAAMAAKEATRTIPVVFAMGGDPVETGLVASLNHPGGNLTGIAILGAEIATKRLDLLRKLVPAASSMAMLSGPANLSFNLAEARYMQAAARVFGVPVLLLHAGTEREITQAFASLVEQKVGALLIGASVTLDAASDQIIALAAHHGIPTMFFNRSSVLAGALLSYGPDGPDANRQAGVYAGRILKGENPADLPVQQPTKFELVLNLKTAKALGLTIPPNLLAIADEVIE
jgi:putative tryptophan/tyrosine transport system substrate-binding protein